MSLHDTAMKMALELKKQRNCEVALLIIPSIALREAAAKKPPPPETTTTTAPLKKWEAKRTPKTTSTSSNSKPDCPSFCFGLDLSDDSAGHTAVVNVVQHACERYGAEARQDALIYLTCPPSNADRGIFVQQITGTKPRLIYIDGNKLHIERPAKWKLVNPKGIQNAEDAVKAPEWSLEAESDIEGILSDQKRIVFDKPWPVNHVAPWISPPKGGATYEKMSVRGQQLFDHLFLLVAYSLAAPTDNFVETHLGSDQDDPSKGLKVGALLVSPSGELLSWGADFSSMLHAEVSTLKLYSQKNPGRTLPANARLYTSLEPCFQCAGLISTCAHPQGLTVVCGQVDQGLRIVQAGDDEKKGDLTFLKEGSPFKPKNVQELFPQSPYLKLNGKEGGGTFANKLGTKQGEAQDLYKNSTLLQHQMHQSDLKELKKAQAELKEKHFKEKKLQDDNVKSIRIKLQTLKSQQPIASEEDDSEETGTTTTTTTAVKELEAELTNALGPLKELGERQSAEVKEKQQKVKQLEKQISETDFNNLASGTKHKYAKSIMETLGLEFYSRRLVKARLQLVLMARIIMEDSILDDTERLLLLRLWDNAMFLLLWVGRATHRQLISNAVQSLAQSRGKNTFKTVLMGTDYTEKPRPDLEQVRLELNDILTEAKRFLEKQ